MSSSTMVIDVFFIIILALAIFKGITKGLVVAVFSFFAFLIGIAAALKLSALVAVWLAGGSGSTGWWLPVLSFFLVFTAVVVLVHLGAKLVKKAMSLAMLGWADAIGGIMLYTLLYLFIFSIILFYAANIGFISEETQQASRTFKYIAPFGPKVVKVLGLIFPFIKDVFGQLSGFFEHVADGQQ